MGKFVLPDEDTWVLPDAWRQALHPRRGGHPAPERLPAPEAAEKIREWLRSDLLPAMLLGARLGTRHGVRSRGSWRRANATCAAGRDLTIPATTPTRWGPRWPFCSSAAASRVRPTSPICGCPGTGSSSPPGSSGSWPGSWSTALSGRSRPHRTAPTRACGAEATARVSSRWLARSESAWQPPPTPSTRGPARSSADTARHRSAGWSRRTWSRPSWRGSTRIAPRLRAGWPSRRAKTGRGIITSTSARCFFCCRHAFSPRAAARQHHLDAAVGQVGRGGEHRPGRSRTGRSAGPGRAVLSQTP